jgi:hypothetical protein
MLDLWGERNRPYGKIKEFLCMCWYNGLGIIEEFGIYIEWSRKNA